MMRVVKLQLYIVHLQRLSYRHGIDQRASIDYVVNLQSYFVNQKLRQMSQVYENIFFTV